ncbi:MAG: hypothetical protein ACOC07_14640 [Coleofasciculus sp.]
MGFNHSSSNQEYNEVAELKQRLPQLLMVWKRQAAAGMLSHGL